MPEIKKWTPEEKAFMKRLHEKHFDKYGMTGVSGFVEFEGQVLHLNACFSAGEGNIFVEYEKIWEEDGGCDIETTWKRVKQGELQKPREKVIQCTYCGEPAVSLDHSWPYQIDETVCANCFDKRHPVEPEERGKA